MSPVSGICIMLGFFSSSGVNQETQQTFFYQLIMEKDERLVLPTTQQLFELSFLQMGIKLREVSTDHFILTMSHI